MNPLAGLTMYDALAMLVSGFMWGLLLFPWPDNIENTCSGVLFGILCYIIGLVYHKMLDVLLGPWNFLKKQWWVDLDKAVQDRLRDWNLCNRIKTWWVTLKAFLQGNKDCLRNNPNLIAKAYAKVQAENSERLTRESSENDYYTAYYRLMKNNCLGNIPVLEAHVAFIRNIVPILIVYLVTICFCSDSKLCQMVNNLFGEHCHCVWILWLALIMLLICIRFWIQNKIHELVWEGSCFIKE
ncbi:MAG: hypothetical protein K2H70_02895 [Bacteroidales bacterium]|nr:hypothetical protein [Bacteroidales bacterium]